MKHLAQVKSPAKVIELTERHVASVRATALRHRVRHTVAVLHELVMDAVGVQGLAPAGPLFTAYHSLGSVVTLEAGLPLSQTIRPEGIVEASILPGGTALQLRHFGDLDDLPDIRERLEEHGYGPDYRPLGSPWESYVVDGLDTSDVSEWITDTYIPVSPVSLRTKIGTPKTGRTALDLKRAIW